MKISTIAALSLAALIGGTSLSIAQTGSPQVPNPADPAPANPTATNGAPTEAPAKAGNKMGTGATGGAMMSKKKKSKKKMSAHVAHHMRMKHATRGKMAGHRTF